RAHLARLGDDVVAGDGRAAAGRQQQGRQHPYGRRLAGAVWPEERVDLALIDGEVDAADRAHLFEGPFEPLHADRLAQGPSRAAASVSASGGRASTQRRPFARSSASAASSRSSSRPQAASSCRPIGRPAELSPTGTLIAGVPVRLARAPPRTFAR